MNEHEYVSDLERAEKLIAQNPKVSKSVVTQHLELEARLRKLGIQIRPSYTLSPPLGGAVRHFASGN